MGQRGFVFDYSRLLILSEGMPEMSKKGAYRFFKDLEGFLNRKLPPPSNVRREINAIVKSAKNSAAESHKAFPEGAFLNHYIAPLLYEYLSHQQNMNKEKARQALLSESYRKLPHIASGSPARSIPHPFKKVMGVNARQVIKQWKGEMPGSPVVQSCPDLALRPPFPYKVVIEGKYFSKGGITAAETSLATDIYQAFFYLGLPYLPETRTHPAWDYEYACLLAYDATDQGSLLNAWESIDPKVKKGCWEGANIYVMILRGS